MSLFLISLLSTFFGALCGGGASIISTPLFFEFGMPALVVLAVTKSNSTVYASVATRNFLRRHPVRLAPVIIAAIVTLPLAYGGTVVARQLSPGVLKQIIGVLLIAVSLLLLKKRTEGGENTPVEIPPAKLSLLMAPFAAYEGFFGSGNNVVVTTTIMKTSGCEIKEAYSMYYFFATAWCGVAAACYLIAAPEAVNVLIPCIGGSLLGGYLGSKVALRLSNKHMKFLVIAFGIGAGLRLLVA